MREFYANIADDDSYEVMVRGRAVSYHRDAINELFGIDVEDLSDYDHLILAPAAEDFDKALQYVATPDSQWCISSGGVRTLMHTALLPEAGIWLNFLKCRLMPTTHDTTVSQERVLLLYCLLAGLSINVGRLICRQITSCAKKKKGKLFFPSLITQLCIKAGVPTASAEDVLFERNDLDFTMGSQPRVPSSVAGPSIVRPASSLASLIAQQQEILGRLVSLETQQHDYWKYAKQRDAALIKSLQRNFTKPTVPFPAFPSSVLEAWTAPVEQQDPSPSDVASED